MSSPTESTVTEATPTKPKLTKAEKKELYRKKFPEPIQTRRELFKKIFMEEPNADLKMELLTSIVFEICHEDANPVESVMALYETLPDVDAEKPKSSAGLLLDMMNKWIVKLDSPEDYIRDNFTLELRCLVFQTITKHHSAHISILRETFKFDDSDLVPTIKAAVMELNVKQKFKQAMDIVDIFGLDDHYGLEDFLIPCILQDQMQNVKTFMDTRPHIAAQVVRFFDNFIDRTEEEVKSMLHDYREKNIMKIKLDRFQGKTIEKQIRKLLSDMNLESHKEAPRFTRQAQQTTLRYQARQRFGINEDGQLVQHTDDVYFGNAGETLRMGDMQLKRYFLNFLCSIGQLEDAVRWVVYFDIPGHYLPNRLDDYISRDSSCLTRAEESIRRVEDVAVEKLELKPGYPIVMVDTWELLQQVIEDMAKTSVIGLDSEWKPQYLATSDQIAVLQIALDNAVYLVDFCSLEKELNQSQWEQFLTALLTGDSIKLGFDFLNDQRAMFTGKFTHDLKHIEEKMNMVVCIKRLVDNLLYVNESFVDLTKTTKSDSDESLSAGDFEVHFKLSDLSEKLCGVILDKSEQCSNWAKRPLRKKQLEYAAMDAYIVVEIYNKIKERALELEMDFDRIQVESQVNAPKREKLKKQRVKMDDMAWSELVAKLNDVVVGDTEAPRSAADFHCIVDLMLLGLGKNLRRVGVNVLIPNTTKEFQQMARQFSKRTLLSSGKGYDNLRQLFPGRVFCIPQASKMSPLEQVKFVVMRYNIELQKNAIFSRCMECNAAYFVRVPSPVLQALHERHVVCMSPFHDEPFDFLGWIARLRSVDPEEHEGHGCRVDVDGEYPDWVSLFCTDGYIDLTKNMVAHDDMDDGCLTQIHKVPENVVSRPGRFYYICAMCGKIYWDGSHAANFEKVANELIECSRSRPASTVPA